MDDTIEVTEEQLLARLRELGQWQERTMALLKRVFTDDAEARERTGRVLDTGEGDASLDLAQAIDRALDERDAARVAAARFESHGEHYAAEMVRGRA